MITTRMAHVKRATLLWNLLNVRGTASEIVDPCYTYLLHYLTIALFAKNIYKSNNFVKFDEN